MIPSINVYTTELPLRSRRVCLRYSDTDGFFEQESVVATEYALTVYVNENEMATIVCTPEHMDELVIGFLASEGVIRTKSQIKNVLINTRMGTVRVKTATTVNFNQKFYNKRYIASCCGKSRQSFYFYNDAHTAKVIEDKTCISSDSIFSLIENMETEADLFHETGGVHIASLCDANGVLVSRMDIGRHNALDKLYGFAIDKKIDLQGKMIAFSGRLSSEVLLKVAKIGVGIVIARSAPTELALNIAEELKITAIGFVRGKSFNVYSHPWRVKTNQKVAKEVGSI